MDQSSKQPPDENARLMRKVADSDVEAFKLLYQRFAPLLRHLYVRRCADRNSADDFVQKIFIILWEQRKSFRGESSFETYLFTITRNTLNNEIRQSRKITGICSKKHTEYDGDTYNLLSQPEAEFYFQELTDSLKASKTKLIAKQQQAMEASLHPDIDFNKVLEDLSCSKEAYKSRLKRTRKRLRELLAPFFSDEERRN